MRKQVKAFAERCSEQWYFSRNTRNCKKLFRAFWEILIRSISSCNYKNIYWRHISKSLAEVFHFWMFLFSTSVFFGAPNLTGDKSIAGLGCYHGIIMYSVLLYIRVPWNKLDLRVFSWNFLHRRVSDKKNFYSFNKINIWRGLSITLRTALHQKVFL